MQLFLIPLVSLYSVARGDVCPGASTAVKGPGPSLSQEEFIEALLVSLLPRPRNIFKFAFGGGLFL